MAVKLRLRRMGKKRQPVYKVVAADARSPRDGKFIEAIGLYNPKTEPATIEIKEERALYWLGVGAQPTITVRNLLSKSGIMYKRELLKEGLGEEEISSKLEEWQKAQEAKSSSGKKKVTSKKEKTEITESEDKTEVGDTASEKASEENPG